MSNETSQAQWVESDGVSNLPTAAGVYEMRMTRLKDKAFSLFDGNGFKLMRFNAKEAANQFEPTLNFASGACNAWRDFQGLMSKPAKVVGSEHVHQSGRGLTQAITYFDPSPYLREDGPVQPSDEPGIAAMAVPTPTQVAWFEVDGVKYDKALLAQILDSQRPKPIPNTTPRGIMAVWNETADHRLGCWNQGAME